MSEEFWDVLSGEPTRDRRNVRLIMDSVAALFEPRAYEDVLRASVDRAIEVTGAQRGVLLLEGPDGLTPAVARHAEGEDLPLDLKVSRSFVDDVWVKRKARQEIRPADGQITSVTHSMLELRLLSVMAAPLVVRDDVRGVLYVDSRREAKEFTKADFTVFRALGGVIGMAVEFERLRLEREEKERMERQLQLAHDVQRGLLPADLIVPAGYDLAGEARACEDVSGDYYDVIPTAEGRVVLVVGDVSGHGIGPAIYMASTRAFLHALLGAHTEPLDVMRAVNAFLIRDMPANAFMSLFVGVLEPEARRLTYLSAGHNPPVLRRKDGTLEELRRTGPLLAIQDDARYLVSDPVQFEAGDALVLYTDGIFEASGPDGERYEEERFQASLARHLADGHTAREVVNAVLADLDAFRAGHPLEDDVTCLVLRVG